MPATRTKLKNIMLGEKPDMKATYYIIRFNQKRQVYEERKYKNCGLGWE